MSADETFDHSRADYSLGIRRVVRDVERAIGDAATVDALRREINRYVVEGSGRSERPIGLRAACFEAEQDVDG